MLVGKGTRPHRIIFGQTMDCHRFNEILDHDCEWYLLTRIREQKILYREKRETEKLISCDGLR